MQELYAELHWDSDDPAVRARAIVSKAVQELDADPGSPLHHRIQASDAIKDNVRCISLASVYEAVEKNRFHIEKEKTGQVLIYGPLWATTNDQTLRRTVSVLSHWFEVIRSHVPDWWDKGSGEGGGLAMNDGVKACVHVLSSVFRHLDATGQKLLQLDDEDLAECLQPYADALGAYFATLSESERKSFRDLRGNQGLTTRLRRCERAIHERIPQFNPKGLNEYIELEKAQTNLRAKEIIDRMEKALQQLILEELKREFGADDNQWWMLGIPKQARLKVTQRFEEEDGKRGGREYYFDLIDYRTIAVNNWTIFEKILAYGKSGNKEKRTSWMSDLNEKRKVVSHASSAVTIGLDELEQLQEYERWFNAQLAGGNSQDDITTGSTD